MASEEADRAFVVKEAHARDFFTISLVCLLSRLNEPEFLDAMYHTRAESEGLKSGFGCQTMNGLAFQLAVGECAIRIDLSYECYLHVSRSSTNCN